MTNLEIIKNEAINNKIFTEEECDRFLMNLEMIPLHTFAMWRALGFVVKKGQHARVQTKLWRFKSKKVKNDEDIVICGDKNVENDSHYYLAKAFLFTKDQVERYAGD